MVTGPSREVLPANRSSTSMQEAPLGRTFDRGGKTYSAEEVLAEMQAMSDTLGASSTFSSFAAP
jgi:hypothetical protein